MRNYQNNRRFFQQKKGCRLNRTAQIPLHNGTTRSRQRFNSHNLDNTLMRSQQELKAIHQSAQMQEQSATITAKDIARLWANMSRLFGKMFTSNFTEQDNGVWLNALHDLTPAELQQGFRTMTHDLRAKERIGEKMWPPNAMDFYHYCRKPLSYYGLPQPREAYRESRMNALHGLTYWQHAAVYNAAKELGYARLTADDYLSAEAAFIAVYQRWIERVRQDCCGELPANARLTQPEHNSNPEYVRTLLAEFYQQHGLNKTRG